jgi:hypothetical protein
MKPFFKIILNASASVLALNSTEISRNKIKYLSAVIVLYCFKYPNIQNVYLCLYIVQPIHTYSTVFHNHLNN